jgi:signal transduction histidine kinase
VKCISPNKAEDMLNSYSVKQLSIKKIPNALLLELRLVRFFSRLLALALDKINARTIELMLIKERAHNLETECNLRDQFISILTHDLRTPLTAAKMAVQLILRRPEDIERNKILASKVVSNINRIDLMIKDLLDANKIRAGVPLIFTIDECDLRLVALMALRDLGISYSGRLLLELEGENIKGFWNENAIRRVIENLVNNAIKYGSTEQLITVKIKQLENQIQINVHNSGNPIPTAEQLTLFHPFQRTPSAQNGNKKGWGLGLTMVKGVVDAHGGNVEVISNESVGTHFIVTIPRDSRPFQILK